MRGPTTYILLVIAIFVSFTVSGTLAVAGEVNDVLPPPVEPRPPTIIVTLSQDEIEIQTGPGHSGEVTVNGTMRIEKPREARTEVVLISSYTFAVSDEIITSVHPAFFEMGASAAVETYQFNINLQVPPMIPSVHIDGTFHLTGNWTYKYSGGEGEIPDTTGVVVLKPFCYFMGFMPNVEKLSRVPIGSWRTAEFEIQNNGNDRTTSYISERGDDDNVDCVIGDDRVTLNEGESVIVPIKVRINEGGTKPKIYTQGIRLEATDADGQTVTYDTEIHIESFYTPGSFLKSTLFKLIIAGSVVFTIMTILLVVLVKRRRRRREGSMEVVDL